MNSAEETRRLAELYARMSEEELESIAGTAFELTEEAEAALRDEIRRRNLAIPLATEPPGYDALDFDELVTIRRFRDLGEAMFAKSLLEDAGIECFLADENTIRMNWLYANAIGGMRLQVRPADADQAIAILDAPPAAPEVDADV